MQVGHSLEPEKLDALISRLDKQSEDCKRLCRLKACAEEVVWRVLGLVVPEHGAGERSDLRVEALSIEAELAEVLATSGEGDVSADEGASRLMGGLEDLLRVFEADAEATFQGDPAAQSPKEVRLSYPGFYATAVYRISHLLWLDGFRLVARLASEKAHRETGIDIHPGAEIGVPFVIDHGTGVVIGESAKIGRNVKLYQGVTLGALSVNKALAGNKRHPTIQDDVVIYAGAKVLGGRTVIGRGATLGGNVWVTQSVPAGAKVVYRSETQISYPENSPTDPFVLDYVI